MLIVQISKCDVRLFRNVGQYPFRVLIKRDAFAKFYFMETYASQADDLYQEANEIECPNYFLSYTSCYESLSEFEETIIKAREMESAARDIQKKFQESAASELPIPSSWLLKKAIISVKIGKVMFSMDELVQVFAVLMGNLRFLSQIRNETICCLTVVVHQHERFCM